VSGARVRRVGLPTGPTVAYVAAGPDGATPPLLLLHPWGEARGCFDRLVPLLPGSMRTLALDQRGHGDSDRPVAGYALTVLADDVVAFLDAIDVRSAVLVGSSSGGYVAQQVALTHPDRVAGLVLVGAPRSLQGRPDFADEVEALADPVDPDWVRQSLAWFRLHHPVPAGYVEDRVADGARIPAHVWRQELAGLVTAVPPTEAGTIDVPTLMLWGERDDLLTRADQEALAAAIPGARLQTYAETGHLVLWEQPARVAADVTAFVATLPPA
jgi:pimeloyl-ACP methyl ester carboxylesterase